MKTFLSLLGSKQIAALILCAVLALFAFVLKFILPGYSFSALVCVLLILLILFYSFMPIIGLKYPKFAQFATRFVTVILIIGVLIAGITEFFLIRASFGNPGENCEYIVVLGAKVRSDGPSVALWERINAAYAYLEENPHVIAVVSGGQGADEPMSEALCMYQKLIELGIDPNRVWMEDKATSTWENLQFSLDLIEEKTGTRPEKLGIVSSEYHMFRASLFAKACSVEFVGIPAHTTRLSQMINHFMREVAGVWHYIILGGQYHA